MIEPAAESQLVHREGKATHALPPPILPERVVASTKQAFPRWWVAGIMAGLGTLIIWRHYEPHTISGPVLTVNSETMAQAEQQVSISASQGALLTARG